MTTNEYIEYLDQRNAGYLGYRGPGWYFICEDWATYMGPYQTEEACKEALVRYARALNEEGLNGD